MADNSSSSKALTTLVTLLYMFLTMNATAAPALSPSPSQLPAEDSESRVSSSSYDATFAPASSPSLSASTLLAKVPITDPILPGSFPLATAPAPASPACLSSLPPISSTFSAVKSAGFSINTGCSAQSASAVLISPLLNTCPVAEAPTAFEAQLCPELTSGGSSAVQSASLSINASCSVQSASDALTSPFMNTCPIAEAPTASLAQSCPAAELTSGLSPATVESSLSRAIYYAIWFCSVMLVLLLIHGKRIANAESRRLKERLPPHLALIIRTARMRWTDTQEIVLPMPNPLDEMAANLEHEQEAKRNKQLTKFLACILVALILVSYLLKMLPSVKSGITVEEVRHSSLDLVQQLRLLKDHQEEVNEALKSIEEQSQRVCKGEHGLLHDDDYASTREAMNGKVENIRKELRQMHEQAMLLFEAVYATQGGEHYAAEGTGMSSDVVIQSLNKQLKWLMLANEKVQALSFSNC